MATVRETPRPGSSVGTSSPLLGVVDGALLDTGLQAALWCWSITVQGPLFVRGIGSSSRTGLGEHEADGIEAASCTVSDVGFIN